MKPRFRPLGLSVVFLSLLFPTFITGLFSAYGSPFNIDWGAKVLGV